MYGHANKNYITHIVVACIDVDAFDVESGYCKYVIMHNSTSWSMGDRYVARYMTEEYEKSSMTCAEHALYARPVVHLHWLCQVSGFFHGTHKS